MKIKNGFSLLNVIVVVIITGIMSALTTGLIIFSSSSGSNIDYHKLTNDKALSQFLSVYSNLLDNYYENIDTEEMLSSAISAMLDYLGEDYTTYMNQEETKNLAQKMSGYYEGVGISIKNNVIVEVHENTPAAEAGILAYDQIVKINDVDVETYDSRKITSMISSFKEDKFTLEVRRDETILSFTLKREKILYPVVRTDIFIENEKKIGYINLNLFSQTAEIQVNKALDQLENEGIDSLILDLRENSGGLLLAAEDIANLFLEKGKNIYLLDVKEKITTFVDKTDSSYNKEIIVLVNEGSASASEILAAALKESYGATLVGTKTFGKGKVQQTSELDDGTMVKYTTAKWLTPNGNYIDGIGIIPDYEVGLPEYIEGADFEDTQLNEAIRLLAS